MNNIKRKSNFTTVENSFIRNPEISFKAKGLFIYMASMSEDWNFTIKSISTQSKEGVDSIKNSLKELKKLGYIVYEKHSDGTGTYHLYDIPVPKVENPDVGFPYLGKSTPIKKNNPIRKKRIREEEDILSFVSKLREKYINVSFNIDGVKYFICVDGFLKVFENSKKVSGGRAKDIYKRMFLEKENTFKHLDAKKKGF